MYLQLFKKKIVNNNINIFLHNLGNYKVPGFTRNGICVDVGANVGSFIKKYHEFFKIIYYYEPQIACYEICKKLDYKNIIGFNEAVYNTCGKILPIVSHSNHESGSCALLTDSLNSDWEVDTLINNVKTVDLATVVERAGGKIDYMKIDCETSEYYLLINNDIEMIKCIGIELHWQMGESKYCDLVKHISQTHNIIGDYTFQVNHNKEVLCIDKHI